LGEPAIPASLKTHRKGQIMTQQDDTAPSAPEKLQGEGNYDAARKFDADETKFIANNRDEIAKQAKAAADALAGPEGDELRAAEAETRAHSAE
jgi:hypothetical protein